jgi:hypothetical protein
MKRFSTEDGHAPAADTHAAFFRINAQAHSPMVPSSTCAKEDCSLKRM